MILAFAHERIEHWPLARLHPYTKSAKMHGPIQVAKLAASMAEFYKHCLAWEQQSVRRKTALPILFQIHQLKRVVLTQILLWSAAPSSSTS